MKATRQRKIALGVLGTLFILLIAGTVWDSKRNLITIDLAASPLGLLTVEFQNPGTRPILLSGYYFWHSEEGELLGYPLGVGETLRRQPTFIPAGGSRRFSVALPSNNPLAVGRTLSGTQIDLSIQYFDGTRSWQAMVSEAPLIGSAWARNNSIRFPNIFVGGKLAQATIEAP